MASFCFSLRCLEVSVVPNVLIMADIRRNKLGGCDRGLGGLGLGGLGLDGLGLGGFLSGELGLGAQLRGSEAFLKLPLAPYVDGRGVIWVRPCGARPGEAGCASVRVIATLASPATIWMIFAAKVTPSRTKVWSPISTVVSVGLGTLALVVLVLASSLYGGRSPMVVDCSSRLRSCPTEKFQSPHIVIIPSPLKVEGSLHIHDAVLTRHNINIFGGRGNSSLDVCGIRSLDPDAIFVQDHGAHFVGVGWVLLCWDRCWVAWVC